MNNHYVVREELREVLDKAGIGQAIDELLDSYGPADVIDYLLHALMVKDRPAWWSKLVDILEPVSIAAYKVERGEPLDTDVLDEKRAYRCIDPNTMQTHEGDCFQKEMTFREAAQENEGFARYKLINVFTWIPVEVQNG